MDRLAWVEVIGRHRDVESRHPVYRFPIRIGRGYDCDVILDDPFVAPAHCAITETGHHQFALEPLSQGNGVQLEGRRLAAPAPLTPDQVFRCGHTQLRIRPADYPVVAEQPFPRQLTLRHPLVLVIALAILMGLAFLDAWNSYMRVDMANRLFLDPAMKCAAALLLAIPWALGGRAAGGKGNYTTHAAAASLLFAALLFIEYATEIAQFALAADWPGILGVGLMVIAIGWTLNYQFRLALRASPLAVAIWSTLISVALVAAWQIDARLDANRDMERLDFNTAVAPPFFLMVEGKPVDAFMDSLAPAREAVDQMANARLPVH